MACAMPASFAEYDCARSSRALGKGITSEDRFMMSLGVSSPPIGDVMMPALKARHACP